MSPAPAYNMALDTSCPSNSADIPALTAFLMPADTPSSSTLPSSFSSYPTLPIILFVAASTPACVPDTAAAVKNALPACSRSPVATYVLAAPSAPAVNAVATVEANLGLANTAAVPASMDGPT